MKTRITHTLGYGNNGRTLWVALALAAAMLFPNAPVQGDGTPAGQVIRNRATATYVDPNNAATTLNTTSNEVTVTVAEVAGITVTPSALTDVNGNTIAPGDILHYDFTVTNTGNNVSKVFVPNTATVSGPGTLGTRRYSEDNGATYTDMAADYTSPLIAPGASVRIRVIVTVNAGAGADVAIRVVLGNRAPNDNSAATQNQDRAGNVDAQDVYTVDGADGDAGEVAGAPVNGVREASAMQEALVGANPQAFAVLLLTQAYNNNATTGNLLDDKLTYSLNLRVNGAAPVGASAGLSPADLAPAANISVAGATASRILISAAIPVGTQLTTTAIAAVANWTPVYTVTPASGGGSANANTALWKNFTTVSPLALQGGDTFAQVTRIGWVRDAATNVVKGSATVTGFAFEVVTQNVSGTSPSVPALAQLFGTPVGGATAVYDESGDQMPSNFSDDGSTPAGYNTPNNGVADATTMGTDTAGNNTGLGDGGEVLVYTLAQSGAILNGPSGAPGAVNTTNDDDFTDRSTDVAAGTTGAVNPALLTFTNTISNPGGATLTAIKVVPVGPTTAAFLPNNTTVTIRYGGGTATYTYVAASGTFTFTSGTEIEIASLAPGVDVNYQVDVDLPAATTVSAELARADNGYPLRVRAWSDLNTNGAVDAGEFNLTTNRAFVGFLKLAKDARIFDTDGTTQIEPAAAGTYTTTPASTTIRPGRIIEYRIIYTNIATTPPTAGSGNVLLYASNVQIIEDGTGATAGSATNNWATVLAGTYATSNLVGSAVNTGGTATLFFHRDTGGAMVVSGDITGTTAATDVTKYVVQVSGTIAPGSAARDFKFKRRIN